MLARIRRKAALFPAIYSADDLEKIRSMRLFDEHIVARYGGFAGADDYYYSVASSQHAGRFRVPTLILHSLDDPFIRMLLPPAPRSSKIPVSPMSKLSVEAIAPSSHLQKTTTDAGRKPPFSNISA